MLNRKTKFYLLSFLKHDFRASITVFFVALPLCLGISLASGAHVYSGLVAGIIGGLVISLISKSQLSVSGPAAGLTAVCMAAIVQLGTMEKFFAVVAIAGLLQVLLGILRLGGFTSFIPSTVIKGMLAAIGIILITRQIPIMVGYDKPDFWNNEVNNIFSFRNSFEHINYIYHNTSAGALVISFASLLILIGWKKFVKKIDFIPASFVTVLSGILLSIALRDIFPTYSLKDSQFVSVPKNIFEQVTFPTFNDVFNNFIFWKYAIVICFVATLETLLSIEAIDKLDPSNRITPQNRELIAQGSGNFLSGLIGGIPITAVIVRSSANAEAGGRTKFSSFAHGVWLFLAVLFAIPLINKIPYCVLGAILFRTGYNLAKPKMILAVYRQGREQFLPFIITIISILLTDLLTGVLIGIGYTVYFIVKHTYRAGYTVTESEEGHTKKYVITLALNVSFLNKKKLKFYLDRIREYSVVEISGTNSVYIDYDILEILHDFKAKARIKHIELFLRDIPDVETIELH